MTPKIPEKILFVDDNPNVLEGFRRQLRSGFNIETAAGGASGLEVIEEKGPFAVIVSDMRMPQMDGIKFLTRAKELTPDSVRIMLTGNADQATASKAVNEGSIFRFLTKPCPMEDVGQALVAGIEQYRLITAEKELLEKTLNGSIEVITDILSMIDPESFSLALQLKDYCKSMLPFMEVDNIWEMELAAMFSRLGYVTIPPELRAKAQKGEILSSAEEEVLSQVPEISHRLLSHIPRLKGVSNIVLYQKKRFDGSGIPLDNVAREDIPLGSRILLILSDLLELEATGISKQDALAEMQNRIGYYDLMVLTTISQIFDKVIISAPDTNPTMELSLADLTVGDLLVSNIATIDKRLLVAKGSLISQTVLEKLRNYAKLIEIKEPIMVKRISQG